MTSRWIAVFGTALLIAASGGPCYAQDSDASFYSVPAMSDPVLGKAHVLAASVATGVVAEVSPATGADLPGPAVCKPISPCAIPSPAARG